MSWLVERKSVRLVIPRKCNGSFLSFGILGATSDDSHSVRHRNSCRAGERKAMLLLRRRALWKRSVSTDMMLTAGTGFFAGDEEEPGDCRNILVCWCSFC